MTFYSPKTRSSEIRNSVGTFGRSSKIVSAFGEATKTPAPGAYFQKSAKSEQDLYKTAPSFNSGRCFTLPKGERSDISKYNCG